MGTIDCPGELIYIYMYVYFGGQILFFIFFYTFLGEGGLGSAGCALL